MGWIEKTRSERVAAVNEVRAYILEHTPDRFWASQDNDGKDTQIMRILLPASEDVYYDILIMTAQLKAARMVAYQLGQRPGEKIAIVPDLLANVGVLEKEIFKIDHSHESGLGLEIVINVPGLTHDVIDTLLGDFLDNDQLPIPTNFIPAEDMVSRLIRAREYGLHQMFPL